MKSFRFLSATALAGAALTVPNSLLAQTAPAPAAESADESADAKEGESIVVTGSRIRRAGFDTLEPATVVSSEYLEARGLTNVADALNEIPGFGVGVNPDGGQSSFGVGQNFVNRFGLGSARTLTLVNGRRFVSTNAPSIFGNTPGLQVDLNVIPSELVDRIENLAIGGAPTYGSDAIAGTVNVILKKNYEGFGIQGLGAVSSRGDTGRASLSAVAGSNYNDGRGNITIAASYDKINGTLASKRPRFFEGIGTGTNPLVGSGNATIPGRAPGNDGRVNPNIPFNTGNTDGIPNSVYIRDTRIFGTSWAGLLLSATGAVNNANGIPRGFGPNNALFQFGPDGSLVTYNPGTPFGTQNASGGDGISIVRDTQQLTSGLERITGNVIAEYEIFDDVKAFAEGTYYFARASELIDQSIYNSSLFGGLSAPLLFSATDPRLTTQARTTLASLGVTSFRLSRASRDLVNNNASGTTEVIRGVIGVEGEAEILGRRWNYEMSANYGRGSSKFSQNVLNQQRFVNAINNCQVAGVTAANNSAPGGILPVVDASCVPLDVFGERRASAAAKAYVTSSTVARAILEQEVYSANIGTSELITLWSGGVGFNVAAERRTERAQFNSDEFQRLGLGRAVPIGSNRGQFTTNEVAVELFVPLVAPNNDVPLIYSLNAEGKARYVNNSVNGGFWAYTYGGTWSPVRDVQFRGNYTRSLRAPSVVELFTPVSPAFNTFPDPCDSTLVAAGTNPTIRARNCAAFYASYGLSGPAFQSAARTATVPITSGGNRSLANEQARSYTFGVVLQPSFIPRFRAAVDWNRIRITGNIASLTNANIAEGCYDNPDFNRADVDNANAFCALIRRDRSTDPARNGQLSNNAARPGLVTNFVNGAFFEFKGLTAEVDYNFPIGDMTVDLGGSLFYLESLRQSNNGVTVTEQQKRLGNPEFAGQLNIGLTSGQIGADFQANYQGPQVIDLRTDTVETRDVLQVGSYWTFNVSTSVKVQDDSILRFTMSNVFDRLPPYPIVGNGLGVYDWIGQRFAVSFEHKF